MDFRGDKDAFFDEQGPFCIIIDREDFKFDDGDMAVSTSTINAFWLKDDCIPAESNSKITTGGYQFKIKGSPIDQFDGWIRAELALDCRNCK